MTNMIDFLHMIDNLSNPELEIVYRHIAKRRYANHWKMAGDEITRIITTPQSQQHEPLDPSGTGYLLDEALEELLSEQEARV